MVYLLHFEQKFSHAQHYIGFVDGEEIQELERRLEEHKKNRGSKLLRALNLAGVGWVLAKYWPGKDRKFERQMKNCKNARRYCPICSGYKTLNFKG